MIEILIIAFIVLVLFILTLVVLRKGSQETNTLANQEVQKPSKLNRDIENLEISQNKFDIIIQLIRESFRPTATDNEDECENQLITFLASRFPAIVQHRGHTSQGRKIDLIIEGTYALELILVSNEGKLISLMEQIVRSKQDFSKMAVILVDVHQVPFEKIEEYCREFEHLGITTIIK